MKNIPSSQRGFTLIQLLVVIGVLAVLLAIVLIAINPARQFSQANNTKRSSDVNAILNSVHEYAADNKGSMAGLETFSTDPTSRTVISTTGIGATFRTPLLPLYKTALPADPGTNAGASVAKASCASTWDTGYKMYVTATDNRLTVLA